MCSYNCKCDLKEIKIDNDFNNFVLFVNKKQSNTSVMSLIAKKKKKHNLIKYLIMKVKL